ncbi:MAG: Gfo/Idh/MocA family oxidoreductase, partial [Anaerohalosphaera sp.]|nr:Gfo/Idh/MocA family oxidoreductase [Anaerohalosphaera sp.]
MKDGLNRRDFLRTTAVTGAGLAIAPTIFAQPAKPKSDDINIGIIGVGAQGQVLRDSYHKMPGINMKAVCDIWDYNRDKTVRLFGKYAKRYPDKYTVNSYNDYEKMLSMEKNLDAVIIATPDFWHERHTVACLKAGLHVYCEKEMSNTIEGSRNMVKAQRDTGKLLQIGHQRRSNPKYIYCKNNVIDRDNLVGRITAVNGQWNRTMRPDLIAAKGQTVAPDVLKKAGFKDMHQFMNWRWYKGLGGGPIVDLGSHQIDIYNWFLNAKPVSVTASGGTDYYEKKTHEWYDTVMAVYEYETAQGPVTAFYQTISTNSSNGYFESFMGTEGTLVITEHPSSRCGVYREKWVLETKWDKWVKKGY